MSADFDLGTLQIPDEEQESEQDAREREQELRQLLSTALPDDLLEDSRDVSSSELSDESEDDRASSRCGHGGAHVLPHTYGDTGHGAPHQAAYTQFNGHYTTKTSNNDYSYISNGYDYKSADGSLSHHGDAWLDGDGNANKSDALADESYLGFARADGAPFAENFPTSDVSDAGGGYGQPVAYRDMQHGAALLNGHSNGHGNGHGNGLGNGLSNGLGIDSMAYHSHRQVNGDAPGGGSPVVAGGLSDGDVYRVTYRQGSGGHRPVPPSPQQTESAAAQEFNTMQQDFLNSAAGGQAMQLTQLQILYQARGREVGDLSRQLLTLQEESARDLRILSHQLALVTGEKEGLMVSLQECQRLVQAGRETESMQEGKLQAQDAHIKALTSGKDQVVHKLQVTEASLESLQQQLEELGRSESLTRARESHERALAVLKQRHAQEVLSLQQHLDQQRSVIQQQEESLQRLEGRARQAEREAEEGRMERAELVNRMTRSLEESQKQCRELLQSGSVQEMGQLQIQLQQALSSRTITDRMNRALQDEVAELKEHLNMYENAAKFGVRVGGLNGGAEFSISESYLELGIKNSVLKPPRAHSSEAGEDPLERLVSGLKGELERSLHGNHSKRQQMDLLRSELEEAQLQLQQAEARVHQVEASAKDVQVRCSALERELQASTSSPHVANAASAKELGTLRQQNAAMQQETQELSVRVSELVSGEERLMEANQELREQIKQMVADFDADKREALERCQRTYEQYHEDGKASLREELTQKFREEQEELVRHYEEQLQSFRAKLEGLVRETDGVKECYITMCREREALEEAVRQHERRQQQAVEAALQTAKKEWRAALPGSARPGRVQTAHRHSQTEPQADAAGPVTQAVDPEEKAGVSVACQVGAERADAACQREEETVEQSSQTELERSEQYIQTEAKGIENSCQTEEMEDSGVDAGIQTEELHQAGGDEERFLADGSGKAEELQSAASGSCETTAPEQHASCKDRRWPARGAGREDGAASPSERARWEREADARLRAALAEARARWGQDKQQELTRALAQCEHDHRALLQQHQSVLGRLEDKVNTLERDKGDLQSHMESEKREKSEWQGKLECEKRELQGKLERVCRELQNADRHYRLQFKQLKARWQAEHDAALLTLRTENQQLREQLQEEALKRAAGEGPGAHESCREVIQRLHDHYLGSLEQLRSSVLQHAREGRDRAARLVHAEVRRERARLVRALSGGCPDGAAVAAATEHVWHGRESRGHSCSSSGGTSGAAAAAAAAWADALPRPADVAHTRSEDKGSSSQEANSDEPVLGAGGAGADRSRTGAAERSGARAEERSVWHEVEARGPQPGHGGHCASGQRSERQWGRGRGDDIDSWLRERPLHNLDLQRDEVQGSTREQLSSPLLLLPDKAISSGLSDVKAVRFYSPVGCRVQNEGVFPGKGEASAGAVFSPRPRRDAVPPERVPAVSARSRLASPAVPGGAATDPQRHLRAATAPRSSSCGPGRARFPGSHETPVRDRAPRAPGLKAAGNRRARSAVAAAAATDSSLATMSDSGDGSRSTSAGSRPPSESAWPEQ